MKKRDFERVLRELAKLSPNQLRKLSARVDAAKGEQEAQRLLERRIETIAKCPWCSGTKFVRCGHTAAGSQRYRCQSPGCERKFTSLTGTPLARARSKPKLLQNAVCMKEGLSVRETAEKLGVNRNTAFRLRHLMMPELEKHQPSDLQGVIEADEMFFRKSYKGQKKGLPRKAYRRGTRAGKRGISAEQVAVETAVSRGSPHSFIEVLPSTPNAGDITMALGPKLRTDAVLVTDASQTYLTVGKALGVTVRQIPRGSHKLGPYHVQNVNALHSRIRNDLSRFRGVATKYLPSYLAWFRFFDRKSLNIDPRTLLLDAIGVPFITS